jgi:PUA domain protein
MRKQLSKSDIKKINEDLSCYGIEIGKKQRVENVDDEAIIVDGETIALFIDGSLIPSLKHEIEGPVLKKITVDMGAVKFVVNGADIMRPGIVEIEDGIEKDQIITIIDVNNKKPLAIGRTMFSTEELRGMDSGKVITNLHHVGDKMWDSY